MASPSFSRRRSYLYSDQFDEIIDGNGKKQATPSGFTASSFDEHRIRAKTGPRILSSMSDLLIVLARSGIYGRIDSKDMVLNLDSRAMLVGSGSQFNVFKNHPSFGGASGQGFDNIEGLVVKRVKVTNFREDGKTLVEGDNYRHHLMSLELEILALCHPGIRNNRNIASLVAWGRDYLDPQTPVPVLFMEAAKCSLGQFLRQESHWGIKHQIALDIASGLEVIHKYHIVHGDMKPENVLVFESPDEKVSFIAKLSDFGLCIDLFNSKSDLGIDDYLGTPGWNAPELSKKDQFEMLTGKPFEAQTMFQFDSYSYGLVLVSIFCTMGNTPPLHDAKGTRSESAVKLVQDKPLPPALKSKLCFAIRGLLNDMPSMRPTPTSDLLRTDELTSYRDWIIANVPSNSFKPRPGITDPEFNQGLSFWARLDSTLLHEMAKSVSSPKVAISVHGETLFGIAMGLSRFPGSRYIDQVVGLIERAGSLGYKPAQAICHQILRAHDKPLPSSEILLRWERNSLESGCMFINGPAQLSLEDVEEAKDLFRNTGGHGSNGFVSIPKILRIARDPSQVAEMVSVAGPAVAVDLEGNSIAHVVAALGILESLKMILNRFPEQILATNDNGETLLYKACQAGQIDIVRALREFSVELPTFATLKENLTPLHWLFMFKDTELAEVCEYLVGPKQEMVNSQMAFKLSVTSSSGTYKSSYFPALHYPFEMPYGTPLHWACASRNFTAMSILLTHGADINARCFSNHPHSTPLALAVHFGDVETVSFLLKYGADPGIKDSKDRTLLHQLSYNIPELHGLVPCPWHYWIRHGNWEEHKSATSKMVELLLGAGIKLESSSTSYPPLTPLLAAAELGFFNGGVMLALLNAGADANDAKATCKDSVLILWSSVAAEKLPYPSGYSEVMKAVLSHTQNLDYSNDQKQTALHVISSIDSSQKQFKSNVSALLSASFRPNIEVVDWNGDTPLLLALMAKADAIFRAGFLLDHGADMYAVNSRGENIFGLITGNKLLMDEDSAAHIKTLLLRLDDTAVIAFQTFEESSMTALWNACIFSRPKTLKLLLDLGLYKHINAMRTKRGESDKTPIDLALDYGEASRQAYIMRYGKYGKTPDPKLIEDSSYQLYDDKQGGPKRACEAYWTFPETIEILRKYGAKRAWELGPEYNCENIEQPADYDLNNIYLNGFTPDTQPHRKHWSVLYELARYKPTWMKDHLDSLVPWYKEGIYRPDVNVLRNWPELREELQRISDSGWIKAVSPEGLMVEIQLQDGAIVESKDVTVAG